MKYEKLREIRSKQKKYDYISVLTLVLATVLCLICFLITILAPLDSTPVLIALAVMVNVAFALAFVAWVDERKSRKCYRDMELYIENHVVTLLTSSGIEFENIKIVTEAKVHYVAFHNQIVNYEKLQSKIDELLKKFNLITNQNTRYILL